jgi:diacylglycerol kinase (ATP)
MSEKKNILFLINPISGIGRKNIIPKCIDEYLDKSKFSYQIKNTEYRKHGHEIALKRKDDFDIIVAIGGDGTVNEIGTALISSKTTLGIIPTGSGNGLARHLNIPLKIKNALLTINKNNSITIDTATVNDIPFLGTCGFGFDAHIAQKFDEYHKRGFISYAKLINKEFKTYQPLTFKINTGKEIITREALMYSVANSSQFGNGFTISPKSDLQDGIFEHIFLDHFKIKNLFLMGRQFFNKQIHESKFFTSFEAKENVQIEILNQDTSIFHIDGESMNGPNHFEIKVVPLSLKIIIE